LLGTRHILFRLYTSITWGRIDQYRVHTAMVIGGRIAWYRVHVIKVIQEVGLNDTGFELQWL